MTRDIRMFARRAGMREKIMNNNNTQSSSRRAHASIWHAEQVPT